MNRTNSDMGAHARDGAQAEVHGDGASAHGQGARSAGSRAVIVDGDNRAPIHTGDAYQTIILERAVDRFGVYATACAC